MDGSDDYIYEAGGPGWDARSQRHKPAKGGTLPPKGTEEWLLPGMLTQGSRGPAGRLALAIPQKSYPLPIELA